MSEFDGQKPRYQFDAVDPTPQADAQEPQYQFDVTAPSEVQETTGPLIVDDFEDAALDEYSGDTGLFVIDDTAPVLNGSYSLKTDAGGSKGLIISTAGLANYLDQGETMAVQLHPVAGNDSRMGSVFFVQDSNNLYLCNLIVDSNEFALYVKSGGGFTKLASSNPSLTQDTEYRVELTPASDGTLTGDLYDEDAGSSLATISATDTTYSDGGNGWRIASGANGSTGDAYDYARLI